MSRYFTEAALDIFNCHRVVVSNCVFEHNTGTGRDYTSYRGNSGAVAFGFNNLPAHFITPKMKVDNCTFYNNTAYATFTLHSTSRLLKNGVFIGRGGSMAVYSNESNITITIIITDCMYERNSAQLHGGGLYTFFTEDMTVYNNVLIKRTKFISNTARSTGGGLFIGYRTIVVDCIFTNNSAHAGGGILEYDTNIRENSIFFVIHAYTCIIHMHILT